MVERRGAKFVRGLVKTIFILCYAAFMLASISHLAYFFSSFEPGGGITPLSYVLAAAFDITALVTTIAVMFFRKSMPGWVFLIVWLFILGIAGYSYYINWEYETHFQSAVLTLQPTGETTPVFDPEGHLHYVPVMRENTGLLVINPLLGAGFVLFSLVYSVVAEFFGTKQPTVEDLQRQKTYLEQTQGLREEIDQLRGNARGPSLIERAKQTALEAKEAVGEVMKKDEVPEAPASPHQPGWLARRRQEKQQREEKDRQIRALLVRHQVEGAGEVAQLNAKMARLLAIEAGLWNDTTDDPTEKGAGPTEAEQRVALREEALRRGLLTPEQVDEEAQMRPALVQYRYLRLAEQVRTAQTEEAEERESLRDEALRRGILTAHEVSEETMMSFDALRARYNAVEVQIIEQRAREEELADQARLGRWNGGQREIAAPSGVPAHWVEADQALPEAPPEVSEPQPLVTPDAYQDWLPVEVVARSLRVHPATVGNWTREDASEPKKIYKDEYIRIVESGRISTKIAPKALTRLLKNVPPKGAKAGGNQRSTKGDSDGRLAAVSGRVNQENHRATG